MGLPNKKCDIIKLQVFVKTPTGETITMNVQNNDTVLELKKKIKDKLDIPTYMQRLEFNRRHREYHRGRGNGMIPKCPFY